MNKKELKFIALKLVVAGCFGAILLYLGKSSFSNTENDDSENISKENREIVWVKSDSLMKYLDVLNNNHPETFEVEASGSKITFRALDEKPFNTLFLDGEYVSQFDKNENFGLKKIDNGYGFSLKVEEKNNVPFVKMPAEIMQSILINK